MIKGYFLEVRTRLSVPEALSAVAGLPTRLKLLAVAATVVLIELALRHLAPRSRAYARWQALFEGIGSIWTAVLLSLVYLLSVGPVSLAIRLLGKDPLDRALGTDATSWRPHEPNPLGPEAAARHQF
jgi:hypothetical protein